MNTADVTNTLREWSQATEQGNSEVNRSVMAYVENNFATVAFMSAAQLAQSVNVSQASITRFANLLGYSGFGQWSKEMQRLIRSELSAPERLWFADNPTYETADASGDRVVSSEYLHLQQLNDILVSPEFETLAQEIVKARQVIFAAARASATLLPYVHYFLSKVRPAVKSASPGGILWERLAGEDPAGILVVALAFPRYPRVLVEWKEDLIQAGFSVAVVTDNSNSPVARDAWPVVTVPVTTESVFDSYATPITLFNLLIRRVAQLTPEQSRARLQQIESLDKLHGVYY